MTEQFDVDALIAERSTTHGDYLVNSDITWKIKDALHMGAHYQEMHPAMKETLDMVAHKMHRIVNGDPWFRDHWVDMTGYPHLVVGSWDRLVSWRDEKTGLVPRPTPSETWMRELHEALANEGLELVHADGRMSLQRVMTPAQRAMAADRAAAPATLTPDNASGPVGAPREAAQPAPATPTAPPAARGLVTFRCDTCGGTGRIDRAGSRPDALGGWDECPDCHGSGYLSGSRPYPAIADDGGPIVLAEDDDVPMPSAVRREPICTTAKEYETIEHQLIEHGSLRGTTWGSLYHVIANADGRFDMRLEEQAEYGR